MSDSLLVLALLLNLFFWSLASLLYLNQSCRSLLRESKGKYLGWLESHLRFLRFRISATSLAVIQLVLVGLLCLGGVQWRQPLLGVCSLCVLLCVPIYLKKKREERLERLGRQTEMFLSQLSQALVSSASLGDALERSHALLVPPLSDDVAEVLQELRLGVPWEQALQNWAVRAPSPYLQSALLILRIGSRTGGSLASTLQRTGENLREMVRLEGVLRTKTAEGKLQARVIALVPFPLLGLLNWIDPDYFTPLQTSPWGGVLCLLSLVLWLGAVWLGKKILAFDVS